MPKTMSLRFSSKRRGTISYKLTEINSPYELPALSIRKYKLTLKILNIKFHEVGTYELLPISQKPLKISS